MNKDRIDGAAKEALGKVKEVAGKVMGDATLEARGAAEVAAGKLQGKIGEAKDILKK